MGNQKTLEHRLNISKSKMGSKNPRWKGVNTKYAGIHKWLNDNYGKPHECEICGAIDRKMYHWANVSKQYLRERTDWKRLCVPCHSRFDGIVGCKRKPFTEEHLRKLRESHLGHVSYWKGKRRNEETKQKISQTLKANLSQ